MAILKLSGLVTKISGAINGSVLGTSQSGSYIRQNSYSQQPNTPLQLQQRSKIYEVAQQWRNLSSGQKNLWQNETVNYPYVNRVGDTVTYTAYSLFNFINVSRVQIGLSVLNQPPSFTAASDIVINAQGFGPATINVSYNSIKTTESIVFYATKPRQYGTTYKNTYLRFITTFANTATNGSFALGSAYNDVFGDYNTGDSIYVVAKVVDRITGIPSYKSAPTDVAFGA